MPRRYPIFQFPNMPLLASMLAGAVARRSRGHLAAVAAVVSQLALLVWARGEIADGANLFRRLLGAGGAAMAVARLVLSATTRRSALRSGSARD